MDRKLIQKINLHYAVIQFTFWAAYCAGWAFVTVILLHRGFTNTTVGIITALASLLPIFLSPKLSALADKDPRFSARRQSVFLSLVLLLCAILLWFWKTNALINTLCFTTVGVLLIMLPPFFNVILNDFTLRGLNVNYGLGRGIGSGGYALFSPILGIAIEKHSPDIALPMFVGLSALLVVCLLLFRYPLPPLPAGKAAQKPLSNLAMMKKYPVFVLLVLGCALMIGGHTIVTTYMIHICEKAGAGESAMGTVLSITAIVEIPVIVGFNFLLKRKPLRFWFSLCAVGYVLRQLLFALASTPAGLYLAALSQLLENSLFVPCSVLYVLRSLDAANQAKGQSMLYTVSSGLGPAIALLIGGRILDRSGIGSLMTFSVSLAVVGALTVILALFIPSKRKEANDG